MTDTKSIRYSDEGEVVRITLSRPPLNILTIDMIEELGQAIEAGGGRPGVKALVLGAEGKAFCAGVAVEDHIGVRAKGMISAFHGVFRRMQAVDCLTVAAVQGAALGGGAELAAFCDVVVAAESASFGQPEVKVGVFPPIAAVHYPKRIGLARTLRLLLSGETIRADEALRIGLVDRVVAPDALAAAVAEEVARVTSQSAVVLRLTKRAVKAALGAGFEEGLGTLEDLYHNELMTTEDAEEGLRAFVEKRKPVWKNR